jgi:hypothetical protein
MAVKAIVRRQRHAHFVRAFGNVLLVARYAAIRPHVREQMCLRGIGKLALRMRVADLAQFRAVAFSTRFLAESATWVVTRAAFHFNLIMAVGCLAR